jgi:hypothetical protein
MSPRRRRERAVAPGVGPPHRAPGAGGRPGQLARQAAWVALASVLVVAGWWFLGRWQGHPPSAIQGSAPRSERTAAPDDPAAGLSPDDAFRAGELRAREGRHLESLPFFRAAARALPGSWVDRQNFSNALFNAAQEGRVYQGSAAPATRSSVERIATVLEAWDESLAADSLAPKAEARALIAYQQGQTFFTYGLPIDALKEFRRACALAPADRGYANTVRRLESELAGGGSAK